MLSTPKSKGELFLASSLRDGLEDNDLRQVRTLLLSKDADPNVLIPTHGITPFHLVIGNDSETFAEEVTKLFLRHGGNPNVRSSDGMTPVHVAAAWGRVAVLELLLANGGDPLCLDDDNRSPFHYAFDGNFYNAVTMLGKYCGMSQDEEEEEDEPKYKLTLDKILINKGDVIAEYVPSEDSLSGTVKTESSEFHKNCEIQGTPKETRSNCEHSAVSRSKDEFGHLNTNNITFRRSHKSAAASPSVPNLDIAFGERSVEDERLLIGEIISRLSDTFVKDSLIREATTVTRTMKTALNNKPGDASEIRKPRSYLPPPKYPSNNLKARETPRRRLVDTSIISKSPNLRLFADEKTPTPSKRGILSPRSYTCRTKYPSNATTPLRTARPDARIKSASSTPKRKQYKGRLYEARKLPKKPERPPIGSVSGKSRTVTPTILDKTYRKNRFGVPSYSPDPDDEVIADRKYLGKNIAVNLDDRMYDENYDSEENDSPSDSTDRTSVESPSSNFIQRLKPQRIYNNIKAEIGDKKPKICNILTSKSTDLPSDDRIRDEIIDKFPISRSVTPKSQGTDYRANGGKILDEDDTKDRAKAILDSPGSSVAVSASSLISNNYWNGDDKEDTRIWLDIEEACRNRCVTPPASVSMIIADDSPSSRRSSTTETTFYSDYGSEEPNPPEFFQDSACSRDRLITNPRMMSPGSCSESFVSVDEEYTYEDAEEGIAFIERHLCVMPSSNRYDANRVKNENFLVDRLEELSLISSDFSPRSSPRGSLSRSVLDDNILRERLTALGEQPGPITKTTFNVYLKRLYKLQRERKNAPKDVPSKTPMKNPQRCNIRVPASSAIPDFLLPIDWTTKMQIYRCLEEQAFKEYAIANPTRKYRGGISKTSFCYLLLDPRVTEDLPRCGVQLSVEDRWKKFLNGVFYVGKGKAARPAAHLYDAFGVWSKRKNVVNASRKIRKILDIWQDGQGVVCLHVFSHTMQEEACSREAAMIDALETTHLTNCNRGTYYGYTTTMCNQEKRSLGKYLLYKSMEIFMHEGERQLFPRNVIL